MFGWRSALRFRNMFQPFGFGLTKSTLTLKVLIWPGRSQPGLYDYISEMDWG